MGADAWVFKYGNNTAVTTTETIWSVGGTYPWQTTAVTLTAESSSANDTTGGSGARTATFYGVNRTKYEIEETVNLNGTHPVTLSTQFLTPYRGQVATAGSGGTNAGNIILKAGSTTVLQIDAGEGQTFMAVYTVPMDYDKASLRRWHATIRGSAANAVSVDAQLWMRPGSIWLFKEDAGITSTGGGNGHEYDDGAYSVAPGTDIELRVANQSATMSVTGTFDVHLYDKNT